MIDASTTSNFRVRSPFMRIIPILILALLIAAPIVAQDQKTAPRPSRHRKVSPEKALQKVIADLTAEAEQAAEDGRFVHKRPDIKTRLEEEQPDLAFPDELILNVVMTRQHRVPFVDGYIRWQLTSFDPPLPEYDYQPLLAVIRAAPIMVENPKARQNVLNTLQRAKNMAISSEQADQLERSLAELDDEVVIATEMNRPATEWREWVARKLGDKGPKPYLWRIERLRAMIISGWPVNTIKGSISRAFSDSIEDETFTIDHRRMVLNHLKEMVGLERKWVRTVTFYANGRVEATIWSSAVRTEDIGKWHKRLLGIEEQP